ncbi:hypothetical protein CWI38_0422p0030, partial [Hamiltosporidium tvaerminnensis]
LQIVETEKLRKYDLLANELGLIYKCSVGIIPYVMTWDGIVTKYHKSHLKRLEIPTNVEAYIQSLVLKKTVETISFDRRRGLESGLNAEQSWERASMGVIMRAEMHEEPKPPLKQASNEEGCEPINNIKGRVVFGRRDSSGERGRIKHIKMGKKILTKNFIHGLLYYYIDCNNYDIDRKIIN